MRIPVGHSSRPSELSRYGAAVAAVLLATALRLVLARVLEDEAPYVFYYPCVAIVSLLVGLGPAVLCLILCTAISVLLHFWAVDPSIQLGHLQGVEMVTFIVLSVVIIAMAEAQRRSHTRAVAASWAAQAEAARLETEINERLRIESALRKSQNGLATAQRIAHLGNWEWNLHTNDMTLSEEACRVLGLDAAAFNGTLDGFLAIVHQDDRLRVTDAFDRAIKQSVRCNVDHRIVQPGGDVRMVNEQGEAVLDESGTPVSFVGTVLDITERKRVEDQLRSSEQRIRMIINSALDALVLLDAAGTVTDWNPQAEAMFGWTPDQAVGRSLVELIVPPSAKEAHGTSLKRFLTAGKKALERRRIEISALHRDGHEFPVELSISPLKLHTTVVFSAFIRDISDRKRSEEALRASNEMQKLLLRELNHRVRNNLAGLISLIDMSATTAADIPSLAATISSRVHSMAAVHAMLSHSSWASVSLEEMIAKLLPHGRRGKVQTGGPTVHVPAQQATAMGMVIGELMANSLKYGALSQPEGTVDIDWELHEGDGLDVAKLIMSWTERGGPPIVQEPQSRLGTSLIKGFVRSDLRGESTLLYLPEGASHRFTMTLEYSHQSLSTAGK